MFFLMKKFPIKKKKIPHWTQLATLIIHKKPSNKASGIDGSVPSGRSVVCCVECAETTAVLLNKSETGRNDITDETEAGNPSNEL